MIQDNNKSVAIGRRPSILTRIHEDAVGMAVWERSPAAGFGRWLNALPSGQLPDGRILVHVKQVRAALRGIFTESHTPEGVYRRMLEDDAVRLVRLFAKLAATEIVDIRLEKIDTNACWKFHLDNVPLRMLTTYRGQATQWVDAEHEAVALKKQRDYNGPVNQLSGQAVAIFKGSQAGEGKGILHRSPPIAGTGETRLFLCLNTPSQASPELWQIPKRGKKVSSWMVLFSRHQIA